MNLIIVIEFLLHALPRVLQNEKLVTQARPLRDPPQNQTFVTQAGPPLSSSKTVFSNWCEVENHDLEDFC